MSIVDIYRDGKKFLTANGHNTDFRDIRMEMQSLLNKRWNCFLWNVHDNRLPPISVISKGGFELMQ